MEIEEKNSHEGETLDKIRDILFGSVIAEFEKRLSELNQRISNENERIEADLKSKHEKIMDELKTLHELIAKNSADMAAEMQETYGALEEKIHSVQHDLQNVAVSRHELSALLTDMATYLGARTE